LFGIVRLALALALAAGSFYSLRELYYGSCVIPGYQWHWPLFYMLPALFAVAAIWFGSELARLVTPAFVKRSTSWAIAIAASMLAYVAIAGVVWVMDPTPKRPFDFPYRGFMSVFWSLGILMESGNFDEHACGQ
jgi:hypothetical protein